LLDRNNITISIKISDPAPCFLIVLEIILI